MLFAEGSGGGMQIEYTMEALRQGASPFKSSTDSSSDSNSFDSVAESLDV